MHVYQHAQGGKRFQEAGCRPEQGEAEVEEAQSDAANQDTCLGPIVDTSPPPPVAAQSHGAVDTVEASSAFAPRWTFR